MLVENREARAPAAIPYPVWTDDWNSLLPALK
jgi:hypothetical protein